MQYLTQDQAVAVDVELMNPEGCGFVVEQLMELAGLSVAQASASAFPCNAQKVLVVCGPGNNGGDGLVAARHLYHFGYRPTVLYPKRPKKTLFQGLVRQLDIISIPFVEAEEVNMADFDIILDAMFGFSFDAGAGIRAPFDTILKAMVAVQDRVDIVAVDIPSGWHVEKGDIHHIGLKPSVLVSLTAPKLAAQHFIGKYHYLGGRFVPPSLFEKYGLTPPQYPGCDGIMLLKE